jgi:hypothetical protein
VFTVSRMLTAGKQGAATRMLGSGMHCLLPVEYEEEERSVGCQ